MRDQYTTALGSYSYFYIMYGIGGGDCKMRMISRGVVVFANAYTDAQLYIIITNILLDVASIRWHCIGLELTYQYFHTF